LLTYFLHCDTSCGSFTNYVFFIHIQADNAVQVGPWGGKAGDDSWKSVVSLTDDNMRLASISLSTGGCVFSLTFSYVNKDGTENIAETIGGPGGTPQLVINVYYI